MAKKSDKTKVINYVFMGVVLVALVLVIVSMFVGQVVANSESAVAGASNSKSIALFDDTWGIKEVLGKEVGISNTFAIISFIVTIVGLAILLVDGVLHNCLKKNITIIRLIGAAIALIGSILILVSGLVMVSQCGDGLDLGSIAKYSYSAGAGVWLGFIFGLIGSVAGGLPLLKSFN